MTRLFLLLILSTTVAHAVESPDNFCSPRLNSKRYISTDFDSYPRTVEFECTYDCRNGGRTDQVLGITKVRVTNMDEDATMTACQGVKIKKVSWGYDFDKIEPFYAFDTKIKEIKHYAFDHLSFSNPAEKTFLKTLKENLTTISKNYRSVPAVEFQKAASRLEDIVSELPSKTTRLEEEVKKIIEKKGHIPLDGSAQSLISANINSFAAWRIPAHLF